MSNKFKSRNSIVPSISAIIKQVLSNYKIEITDEKVSIYFISLNNLSVIIIPLVPPKKFKSLVEQKESNS